MSSVIGITVDAADYLSGLYSGRSPTSTDNFIAKVAHHSRGYLSHNFVAKHREDIPIDNRLLHRTGTVCQGDVVHVGVGMYRECLGPANLFNTVTFSRRRRLT